mgnify:CR=1 FL=1
MGDNQHLSNGQAYILHTNVHRDMRIKGKISCENEVDMTKSESTLALNEVLSFGLYNDSV